MKQLKIVVVGYVDVSDDDLPAYDAETIEQAAANQQRWVDENDTSAQELLELCSKVTIASVTADG